jgi:hypothetical protein
MIRAGSPWHHSFPPFDVELLARLHGSKQKLRDKILAMTRVPSTFDHGGACVGVLVASMASRDTTHTQATARPSTK